MKRLPAAVAALALLAALVAIGVLLFQSRTPPPFELPTEIPRDAPEALPSQLPELPRGGVYAGIVVDPDGQPVEGASVLLVAYETGETRGAPPPIEEGEELDITQLPVVGYETAAEGKTDAGGRFRIAADADQAVRMLAAYRMGYTPALLPVAGPSEDLRAVLERAGSFVGTVIDAKTREPVRGAKVTIYMQQRAARPGARLGEQAGAPAEYVPLSPFAVAQGWVAKELGGRVWGLDSEGEPALHTWTDDRGQFRFGPVGNQVQLEFVVTHPEYMWTEFDRTEDGYARRTVVEPGQTVERTFELEPGLSLSGRVLDQDTNVGVEDVSVEIEHVAQYAQHWWYRFRRRVARTGRDGAFRVAGLSRGPYVATLRHPTFGVEVVQNVPEEAKDVRWYVRRLGGLEGRIVGGTGTRVRGVQLYLEPVDSEGTPLMRRQDVEESGRFVVSGIRPGRWRVWVQAAGRSSMPEVVEVQGLELVPVTFRLDEGGRLLLWVYDTAGHPLDPATVRLLRLDGDGRSRLGTFVTREGHLDQEGVAPGRYQAEVTSPGYLPGLSEPFEVTSGGSTDAGSITLRERGWLRIRALTGPDGRPPTGIVTIEVREGAEGTFRPLPLLTGAPIPVVPGPLTVRAADQEGLRFEQTYDVGDGETLGVEIRLSE